jgi:hypothetical protein
MTLLTDQSRKQLAALRRNVPWPADGVSARQPAPGRSRPERSHPKDAIFARKILMDAISRKMDELEGTTSSESRSTLPRDTNMPT